MELADARLIEELLTGGRPQRRRRVAAEVDTAPVSRSRRCECGRCASCRENLRWERIFESKFADPDYYNRSGVPQGSSLNWR